MQCLQEALFALSGRSGRAEDVVHPPLPPPHPPSPSDAEDIFGDEPEALPDPLSPNDAEDVLGDEPEGSPAGSRTPGASTSSPEDDDAEDARPVVVGNAAAAFGNLRVRRKRGDGAYAGPLRRSRAKVQLMVVAKKALAHKRKTSGSCSKQIQFSARCFG